MIAASLGCGTALGRPVSKAVAFFLNKVVDEEAVEEEKYLLVYRAVLFCLLIMKSKAVSFS